MADKCKLFAFLKSISNRPDQLVHEFRFILPVSVNRNVCACIYIWQIRRRQACTDGDSDRESERKFLAALAKRSASSKWNKSRGPITQPFWFLFLYHTNEAAALDLRERAEDEPISFRPPVVFLSLSCILKKWHSLTHYRTWGLLVAKKKKKNCYRKCVSLNSAAV